MPQQSYIEQKAPPNTLSKSKRRAITKLACLISQEGTKGLKRDLLDLSNPSPLVCQPQYTKQLTDADIPMLRTDWAKAISDIACPIPEKLPPFCDINHEINLIDGNKAYRYHHPHCPDHFIPELVEKIDRYVRAGWWVPKNVKQALCAKKR